MTSELLRDPFALVPVEPPEWLIDLSQPIDQAAKLLFDSRLAEMSRRVVDDLVARGLSADEILSWLEDRRRSALSNADA